MEEFLEDKRIFYNDSDSDGEIYDNECSSDGDDESSNINDVIKE